MMKPGVPVGSSESLYDILYAANHGRIVQLCRLLLGSEELADEASQEVFLKLHLALTSGKEHSDWRRWLTRVAVNDCKDTRRGGWWKNRLYSDDDFDESLHAACDTSPEQRVLARHERLRIHGALERLSSRQREIFILRHLEGWSTGEVADFFDLDPGTVKRHLYRAVSQLRKVLRRER